MQKKTLIVALCLSAGAAGALAAQPQDVRVVTADVTTMGGRGGIAGAGNAPMPTGNGVIFGQIKESDSNRPIAGAYAW